MDDNIVDSATTLPFCLMGFWTAAGGRGTAPRGGAWSDAALRAAGAAHRCAVLGPRRRDAEPEAARLRSIAIGSGEARAFLLRRLTQRAQSKQGDAKPFSRSKANADKATFRLSDLGLFDNPAPGATPWHRSPSGTQCRVAPAPHSGALPQASRTRCRSFSPPLASGSALRSAHPAPRGRRPSLA